MGKRLLLVDDDPDILMSLSALLENEGYETDTAENKLDAYQKIKKNIPDLIVLDVNMTTDQEGFEMALELKLNPEYNKIPIIIATGVEIMSGSNKIIEMARKIRIEGQNSLINVVLQRNKNNEPILEYKSTTTGEITYLKIDSVVSKPIVFAKLHGKVKKILG